MNTSNTEVKPRKNGGRHRKHDYPWDTIKVGEKFLVGEYSRKRLISISAQGIRHSKRLHLQFSCRKDHSTNELWVYCEDPRDNCPYCNNKFNYLSLTGRKNPKYHDITVCGECAGKIEYDENLRPRKMSYSRAKAMGIDLMEEMEKTSKLIRALKSLE